MELERYVDILKMTRDDPSSVLAVAANSLPDKLYYSYKHLTKFFFSKGFTSLALMEVQKIIRIPGYRRIYLNYKGRRLLKLNILGQPIISSITSFSNTW